MRKKNETKKPTKKTQGRRRRTKDIIDAPTAPPPTTGADPPSKKKFSEMNAAEKKAHRKWYRENRKKKAAVAARAGVGAPPPSGNGTHTSAQPKWSDFRITGEFTPTGDAILWRIHQLHGAQGWKEAGGLVKNPGEAVAFIARKVVGLADEPLASVSGG